MHKITTKDTYAFHAVAATGEILNATQIYFGCTLAEAMEYFRVYKNAIQSIYPGCIGAWVCKDYEGDLLRAKEKIEELEEELREKGEMDGEC